MLLGACEELMADWDLFIAKMHRTVDHLERGSCG